MVTELAERSHYERQILVFFKLFEHFQILDIFVIDVVNRICIQLLLLKLSFFLLFGLSFPTFICSFSIHVEFLEEQNLSVARMPGIRDCKALFHAGRQQVQILFTKAKELSVNVFIARNCSHTAHSQLNNLSSKRLGGVLHFEDFKHDWPGSIALYKVVRVLWMALQ